MNSIQKWGKENTRLGIPVMFHEQCLHGHAGVVLGIAEVAAEVVDLEQGE
jgi:hypothetical protein